MKIVIAPDSFKGCCTAMQVAQFIKEGIARIAANAQIITLPVADGGEGTVDALLASGQGTRFTQTVTAPLEGTVNAFYGILNDGTCVIEMAAASGLPLVPRDRLNPLVTTTYGTGELIRAGLDRGCRKFLMGIGGSATNDAGLGMAQALGFSFLDKEGKELGAGGAELPRLDRIDVHNADPRLADCTFTVACDVKNTLCGPQGASAVFGPQKGATPEMVKTLDAALAHFAQVVQRDLGIDVMPLRGGGAAGGLGAALAAFCHAEIRSGIDTMLDALHFEEHLKNCDLVITGEGSIDGQSVFGKVPVGVAQRTKSQGPIPVAVIAGCVRPGAEKTYDCGIDVIFPTTPGPMSLDEAMSRAPEFLSAAAERLMRVIRCGIKL